MKIRNIIDGDLRVFGPSFSVGIRISTIDLSLHHSLRAVLMKNRHVQTGANQSGRVLSIIIIATKGKRIYFCETFRCTALQ